MAEQNIAKFKVTADASQFTSEMAKAREAAEKAFGDIKSSAGGLKALLGASFVGFSVAGFTASIKGAIDSLDGLYDLSLRTGASVESLSAFRSVAKLSGTDLELLGTSIQKLSRAMVGADEEGQKSAVAFQRLGINLNDAVGTIRPAEDVIIDVAKALNGLESGTQRVALAQQIFGKTGAQLLPFLKELAETKSLDAKISTEQAEAADKFNDSLVKLKSSSNAWKIELANELLPTLNSLLDRFQELRKAFGGSTLKATIAFAGISGEDERNLSQAIDGTRGNIERIKKLRDELDPAKGARNRVNEFVFGDFGQLGGALAVQEARLKTLEAVLKVQNDAVREQLDRNEGLNAPARTDLKDPPAKVKNFALDEGAQLILSLRDQLDQAAGTANVFDSTMRKLTEGTKVFTEETVATALALAGEVDNMRAAAKANELFEKNRATLLKARDEQKAAAEREVQNLQQLREKYIGIIDPIQKFRVQLDEVRKLLDQGLLTADQAAEAEFAINEQIDAVNNLKVALVEARDIGHDLGLTFTSAFEDAVVEGKKLGDVVKSLGKDLARLTLRKQITEPLFEAGKGALGEIFKGFSLKGLLGFANGGSFTVGGSGGTDSQVVAFRASPGEQVTVATPAQQAGAGVVVHQHFAISAGVAASVRQEIANLMPAIQQATTAGVIDARRRGGRVFA